MGGGSDSASVQKPAESYDRFVGRYGRQLALALLEGIGVDPEWKVLDVGSGPGPLTRVLADAVTRPGGQIAVDVATNAIVVRAGYENFDDLWAPFTSGIGPAGAYCASLSGTEREALSKAYRRRLGSPGGPFELSARAWIASGRVPAADE